MFKKMKFIKKLKLKIWFPIGKHRSPTSRWKSYFSKLGLFKKRLTLTSILETRFPVGNRVSKKIGNWRKPIFAGLIFILIIFGVYFLFFHSSEALAEWWNTNWHYRKAITITNSSSAQTDFQVLVTANTSDTTKFQADCDDLRFTSVNGQALDYWIESGCSTATTKVWVKIASIPANISTIYMYYGNSNASSYQSGDNTFIFFDDFDDNSLDTTKWTKDEATTGSITEENNELRIQEYENNYSHIQKSISGYSNFVVEAKLRRVINPGASWAPGIYVWWNDDSGGNNIAWKNRAHMAGIGEVEVITNGTSASTLLTGSVDTNYRWYRIKISSSNFYFDYSTDGISWSTEHTSTRVANFSAAPALIAFGKGAHKSEYTNDEFNNGYSTAGSIGDVRIDNVFVRKYIATEPTATLQSEEKSPGPVAYWSFDEGYGTTTSDRTTNNNDGTISATWQTEDMCVSGKCLYFDGDTDYVQTSPIDLSDFTLSTWVNIVDWNNGRVIASNGNNLLWAIDTSGLQKLIIISSSVQYGWKSSNIAVSKNVWHYISVVYNSFDGTYQFYLDGVSSGSGTIVSGGGSVDSFSYLRIGEGSYDLKGFIDEVKIYPYALTAAQIKADYLAKGGASSKGTAVSLGGRSSQGDYLSDGLVGYWKMDESSWGTPDCSTAVVTDSSGNGNNGKACPVTTGPTGAVTGKFGNGGIFDGSDDHVSCGTGTSLEVQDLTIGVWVKPGSSQLQYADILDKSHGSYTSYVLQQNSNNLNQFYFSYGDGTTWHGGSLLTTQLVTDVWQYLVITKNGTTIRHYLNGVKTGEITTTNATIAYASNNFHIGSHSGSSRYFNGKIDEVRIYNRALSSREVRQLYEYAPGPVGHWKMDESSWSGTSGEVKDSSGYGNNGTRAGDATTYSPGKYGKAGTFDGSGDRIFVAENALLRPKKAVTVEAWVKSSSVGTYDYVVSKYKADSASSYALYTGSSGGIFFYVDSSGVDAILSPDGGTGIWDGSWHHVAGMYDGSKVELFIDGVSKGSNSLLLDIDYTTQGGLYIGSHDSSSYNFPGLIDDVRFYNYARTQKQILEDMNAGRPAQKSPVGYWKFDEGYGTSAKDSSIYGNNGTITGATWTNAGKFSKALSFNGTSDYVATTNLNTTIKDKTLSAWVKLNNLTQTGGGLVTLELDDGTVFDSIVYNETGNGWGFGSNGFVRTTWSNITETSTDWIYIVATYQDNNFRLYRNGSLIHTSTAYTAYSFPSNIRVLAGKRHTGGSTPYLNGLIDEVKIYNYALTQDEIKAEYNQSKTAVMGTTKNASSTWDDGGFGGAAPIAEWNFEENTGTYAYDTSGNGNTGTLINMEETDWTPGKIGSALDFTRADSEYVNIGDKILDGLSFFTVEAWVKPTDAGITNGGVILEKGAVLNPHVIASTGKVQVYLYGTTNPGYHVSNSALSSNVWQYVTITYDGSYVKWFINSKEDYSAATTGSLSSNANILNIAANSGPAFFFDGKIDQVRIYDYARTPAQVAWDYNKGKPIAHWRFDEGEGTTLYDDSDNNNDGTLELGSLGQTSAGSVKIDANTAWYNGRSGKQNYSLNFDGSDDYIDCGNGESLNISNNIFTISAWVKTSNTGVFKWIYGFGEHASTKDRSLVIDNNNKARMYVYGTNAVSTTTVTDNNWHHLVGTLDGTNARIYVDGILENTTQPTLTAYTYIGATVGVRETPSGTFTAYPFNGQIDDARIYNYALTLDQIKTVYNFGSARLGTGE